MGEEVWFGVVREWGLVVRKQENKTRLYVSVESTTAYESIFDSDKLQSFDLRGKSVGWLVGCFGFNGPLRQYFSLYRAVPQREGERKREKTDERKNVQTTPTRTYCKHNRPLPYTSKVVGRPGTESLPSTFAPPDHP